MKKCSVCGSPDAKSVVPGTYTAACGECAFKAIVASYLKPFSFSPVVFVVPVAVAVAGPCC